MTEEQKSAFLALLAAWRVCRDGVFGRALEELSEALYAEVGEVTSVGEAMASAGRDPVGLEALLKGLPAESLSASVARLELLEFWPPDPRIGSRLLTLIEEPPYKTTSRFYRSLLKILARHLDDRAARRLPQARERWTDLSNQYLAQMLEEGSRSFLTQADVERLLTPEEQNACDVLVAFLKGEETETRGAVELLTRSLGAPAALYEKAQQRLEERRQEEDFLRQIAAEPDDDDHRLVFADWLMERGDPQGEFIILQLKDAAGEATGKEQARMRHLLRGHREAWLKNLLPVVVHSFRHDSDPVFRRGFLEECTLPWTGSTKWKREVRFTTGDPRWGTVTKVTGCQGRDQLRLLLDPCMANLRTLVKVEEWDCVEQMMLGEPRRLEVLEATYLPDDVGDPAELAEAAGLPHLRELHLRCDDFGNSEMDSPADLPSHLPLIEGPLAQQLVKATLPCGMTEVGLFLSVLTQSSSLRELRLWTMIENVELEMFFEVDLFFARQEVGRQPSLVVFVDDEEDEDDQPLMDSIARPLAALLRGLPVDRLASLELLNRVPRREMFIDIGRSLGIDKVIVPKD